MLEWLETEKDKIAAVASIIQSIVVILGILIAINEFYLKDSETYRERIKRTVDLAQNFSKSNFENLKKETRNALDTIEALKSQGIKNLDSESRKTLKAMNLQLKSHFLDFEPYFHNLNILTSEGITDIHLTCLLLDKNVSSIVLLAHDYILQIDIPGSRRVRRKLLTQTLKFAETCSAQSYQGQLTGDMIKYLLSDLELESSFFDDKTSP